MNAQIIKNQSGTPISVVVDYNDWLEIERQLDLKKASSGAPENPLDWYDLTETCKAVLHDLIAYTSREKLKELAKALPDAKHIEELKTLSEELQAINRDAENFRGISRMQEIITKYAPMLRDVYDAA